MSAIFLLPVCLTYWARKYTTRFDPDVDNSHQLWSWYDHTLPSYGVFVCWYVNVTLWPWHLTFWPWTAAVHGGSRDQPCHRLSVLDLWGITSPIVYHWKCVCGHCACAESRDLWVKSQKQLHFWYARPRFAYSLCNFGGSTMKVIKVICENNARPWVKRRVSFCSCATSRDLLKVP